MTQTLALISIASKSNLLTAWTLLHLKLPLYHRIHYWFGQRLILKTDTQIHFALRWQKMARPIQFQTSVSPKTQRAPINALMPWTLKAWHKKPWSSVNLKLEDWMTSSRTLGSKHATSTLVNSKMKIVALRTQEIFKWMGNLESPWNNPRLLKDSRMSKLV